MLAYLVSADDMLVFSELPALQHAIVKDVLPESISEWPEQPGFAPAGQTRKILCRKVC